MSSRIPWRARAGTALLAVLAGTGAFAAPVPAQADSQPESLRSVTYHGYRIEVPADWQVVDLAENPRACLRFDRPAVYLGEPAEQNDCPAGVVGRSAGIVVEPITARSAYQATAATAWTQRGKAIAPSAASSNDTIQIAVEDSRRPRDSRPHSGDGEPRTRRSRLRRAHRGRRAHRAAPRGPALRRHPLARPDRNPAVTRARASTPAPRPRRPR